MDSGHDFGVVQQFYRNFLPQIGAVLSTQILYMISSKLGRHVIMGRPVFRQAQVFRFKEVIDSCKSGWTNLAAASCRLDICLHLKWFLFTSNCRLNRDIETWWWTHTPLNLRGACYFETTPHDAHHILHLGLHCIDPDWFEYAKSAEVLYWLLRHGNLGWAAEKIGHCWSRV